MRAMRMFSVIALCVLIAVPASANYLVNTTFEADSAGPGSWAAGSDWIGQADPASGAIWESTHASTTETIETGSAAEGSQYGLVDGSGTSWAGPRLDFGDSTFTGDYTVSWSMKYIHDPSYNNNTVSATFLRNTAFRDVLRARMVHYIADGTMKIDVEATAPNTYIDVLSVGSVSADTWYDFEVDLSIASQTFDIRVKESSASQWAAELTNIAFRNPGEVDEFARMQMMISHPAAAAWDNIQVVPEPATMALLGLGGLIALKRRRS